MDDRRRDAPTAISVEEHRARILASVSALAPVTTPLAEALGFTLAVDVHALVEVPSFDNSAMDGYAIRWADAEHASPDSPVVLTVVADLPAGKSEDPRVANGSAARIMTGAPVPSDTDCIVPIEDTDEGTETVQVFQAPRPSAHIRRTGTDVRVGDLILTAGRALSARDLSAAASAGARDVSAYPRPRVGVLSTGSELMTPGAPLSRGQIHDSNSTLLAGLVSECGGIPVQLGSVTDEPELLAETLARNAPHVDAFITSGGVSVGAYDVVKAVLSPLGVWFGPVRMQPGKPQGFGEWPGNAGEAGTPIFTLPGNPVSVFVSFEQFVRPALLAMQGRADILRPTMSATASEAWTSPNGRVQFMPALVDQAPDGRLAVRPASAGGSGSYLVASLARANALVRVPESVTVVREGDLVDVTLLS